MKKLFEIPELNCYALVTKSVMNDDSPELGGGEESGNIPE